MAGEINGGLCLLKVGDASTGTEIIGQGDATITHNGAPIELNNKSTGGWRVNLDGSLSTKSVDIALNVTFNDDAATEQLIADAFAGVSGVYTFDFVQYNYSGNFNPVINTETASKDVAVEQAFTFMSSGEITRTKVTP